MIRYIIKRLLLVIPVVIGISLIVFSLMALAPGDPGSIILGASASPEEIEQLNDELGFNEPFFTRYFTYMGKLVTKLDFGTSYRSHQPVMDDIEERLPVTFCLSAMSIAFAAFIGIPLGVLSAVKQYSLLDTFPTVMALIFAAVPGFWLGMLLIFYLSFKAGWFPSFGINSLKSYVLPVITVGAQYAAILMRYTRSSMLETIRQDYVRTARAKGAPERIVIWRHALKNALLPTITVLGGCFGALMGGTIVAESLFSLPGLGTMIINGITLRDVPSVLGATIVISVMYSIILLLVDITYALIDPHIRAKYSS